MPGWLRLPLRCGADLPHSRDQLKDGNLCRHCCVSLDIRSFFPAFSDVTLRFSAVMVVFISVPPTPITNIVMAPGSPTPSVSPSPTLSWVGFPVEGLKRRLSLRQKVICNSAITAFRILPLFSFPYYSRELKWGVLGSHELCMLFVGCVPPNFLDELVKLPYHLYSTILNSWLSEEDC